MLIHYLKIAFRNLWKYKTQSIISIIGLAVGFVCFALSLLWIRYERSYDDFHEGADRIYLVRNENKFEVSGISRTTPYPLAAYLKEAFPEVEASCNAWVRPDQPINVNGIKYTVFFASIDSSFISMFNVKLVEGNYDFLIPESKNIAITEDLARSLFGNENPIGMTINMSSDESTICAIVENWPKHSNYPIQMFRPDSPIIRWNVSAWQTLIMLKPGVNTDQFAEKLYECKIEANNSTFNNILITPITTLRYDNPALDAGIEVQFRYVFLFTLVGGLVVICALFNYLTLFASRFRMRMRELALRIVCGASGESLFALLSTEFIITLFISLLLGMLSIRLLLVPFQKLSNVYLSISKIYLESSLYIGIVIILSLAIFLALLLMFRKRTLNTSINRINRNIFRKTSVIFQLIISIGFIFCSTVIMKQMYFLHHTDMGFRFDNTAMVSIYPVPPDIEVFENQIQQIPEIIETLKSYTTLMPYRTGVVWNINEWDDKPADASGFFADIINISEAYVKFYDLRLLEGEILYDHDSQESVLINESAAKVMGWNQPVGKSLKKGTTTVTIKGVLKDIHTSPTLTTRPAIFEKPNDTRTEVLFRYMEKNWENCRLKIEQLIKREYPGSTLYLTNANEAYDNFLKSETALLKILSFASLVCIIISVFGFFSLVSLICEERQKEIAIRKINGASMQNILWMYFKEYFLLLAIGALIAFPAGYLIMKRWIEQYIQQTTISAWIYLSILLVLSGIIILCVGWRVYQVARQNPAEVVKAE